MIPYWLLFAILGIFLLPAILGLLVVSANNRNLRTELRELRELHFSLLSAYKNYQIPMPEPRIEYPADEMVETAQANEYVG